MTALDDALQAALAAEHRAIFGYRVLGPAVAPALRSHARLDESAHEQAREATATALLARGQTPAGPLADYPDVYPKSGSTGSTTATPPRLAAGFEERVAQAWRFVYAVAASPDDAPAAGASGSALPSGSARSAASTDAIRALAQRALTGAAVRAVRWRAAAGDATPIVPFPGIAG